MNFALACLVILVIGAGWTAIGVSWWMRPTLPEQIEADELARLRRGMEHRR